LRALAGFKSEGDLSPQVAELLTLTASAAVAEIGAVGAGRHDCSLWRLAKTKIAFAGAFCGHW